MFQGIYNFVRLTQRVFPRSFLGLYSPGGYRAVQGLQSIALQVSKWYTVQSCGVPWTKFPVLFFFEKEFITLIVGSAIRLSPTELRDRVSLLHPWMSISRYSIHTRSMPVYVRTLLGKWRYLTSARLMAKPWNSQQTKRGRIEIVGHCPCWEI